MNRNATEITLNKQTKKRGWGLGQRADLGSLD